MVEVGREDAGSDLALRATGEGIEIDGTLLWFLAECPGWGGQS
jgi:hypothetical protein